MEERDKRDMEYDQADIPMTMLDLGDNMHALDAQIDENGRRFERYENIAAYFNHCIDCNCRLRRLGGRPHLCTIREVSEGK